MPKFKDIKGFVFGRLTVVNFSGHSKSKRTLWRCRCNCGKEVVVLSNSLLSNKTISCGCFQRERTTESKLTHGFSNRVNSGSNKLYNVWKSLKQRCNNVNCKDYYHYGGRGISICDSWSEYLNFQNWALKNGYREGLTLERNNSNLSYAPENCSWETMKVQSRNKRNNINITYRGRTKCLTDWAKEFNIDKTYLGQRLRKMSFEEAISTPLVRMRNYKFKSKTIQLCLPGF